MRTSRKNALLAAGGGLIVGALAGLLLAPQSGRRTRALIRDKAVKLSHDVADFTDKKARHTANKMKGYVHEVRGFVAEKVSRRGEAITEETITAT